MNKTVCGKIFNVVKSRNNVSPNAGVYLFLNNKGEIIYVGRTERSMRERISEHSESDLKKASQFGFRNINFENDRKDLEKQIYKVHKPILNNVKPS